MKIGIISDTHGSLDSFKRAMTFLEGSELILHLGDLLYHGPRNPMPVGYNPKDLAEMVKNMDNILFVQGNCDSEVDMMVTGKDISQKHRCVEIGSYMAFLTHGHSYTEENLIEKAKSLGARIVLTGHSHIKHLYEKEGLVFVNPGSTSLCKDGINSLAYYEDGCINLVDIDKGEIIESLVLSDN